MDPQIGLWWSSTDVSLVDAVAGAGLDALVVDLQHTVLGPGDVCALRRAWPADDTRLLVRVPANDPAGIGKVLDAGASGVVVPLVDTVEEADAAVAACRYPPRGRRSFGPMLSLPTSHPESGVVPECHVMVETRTGVDAVHDIAAVEGVTGILVGLADLAIDLGLGLPSGPLDRAPTVLLRTLESVRDACAAAGVLAGVGVTGMTEVPTARRLGFDLVVGGGERALLRAALRRALHNSTITNHG